MTDGYVSLIAECRAIGRLFASNPARVPSFRNQPICRACIAIVNARREAAGLPLWPVAPDAYGPLPEDEL